MNEKPAQALLKILRNSDRAINPSPPDLQSLGLKYDAELSALVSAEYFGFVLSRPRRAGDLFYLYSKRPRFFGLGQEYGWGKWQRRNLGKDRDNAAIYIANENFDFEQAKAQDYEFFEQHVEESVREKRLSVAEHWYRKKHKLAEVDAIQVESAFTSSYDAVLFLTNGHVVVAQVDPKTSDLWKATGRLRWLKMVLRFRNPFGYGRVFVCFSLSEAFKTCHSRPTFDPDLLAQWKTGYPIRSMVAHLCSADAMEQAVELEKSLYIESGRPDQFPILER